jgi:hypothetical protein
MPLTKAKSNWYNNLSDFDLSPPPPRPELLCSCSPKQHDQRDVHRLSNYSDMSAAADAGRTPSSSNARPESGGVK